MAHRGWQMRNGYLDMVILVVLEDNKRIKCPFGVKTFCRTSRHETCLLDFLTSLLPEYVFVLHPDSLPQ